MPSTVMPVLAAMKTAGGGGIGNRDLLIAVAKIVGFIVVGYIIYGEHTRINDYDDDAGSAGNATATGEEEVEDDGWDWDFIDCWYFTMATL